MSDHYTEVGDIRPISPNFRTTIESAIRQQGATMSDIAFRDGFPTKAQVLAHLYRNDSHLWMFTATEGSFAEMVWPPRILRLTTKAEATSDGVTDGPVVVMPTIQDAVYRPAFHPELARFLPEHSVRARPLKVDGTAQCWSTLEAELTSEEMEEARARWNAMARKGREPRDD